MVKSGKKWLLSLAAVLVAAVFLFPVSAQAYELDDLDDMMGVGPAAEAAYWEAENTPQPTGAEDHSTQKTADEKDGPEDGDEDSSKSAGDTQKGGENGTTLAAPVITQVRTSLAQDETCVEVTWEPVEGAGAYQILRRTSETADWTVVGYTQKTEDSDGTSFQDDTVALCNAYYYAVACVDSDDQWLSPLGTTETAHYYPSGSCGEQVSWRLEAGGQLTITGTGPMEDSWNMEQAPWYYVQAWIRSAEVGPGVTSVGGYAFQGCESLETVTLPESVQSIGPCAFFYCSQLQAVAVPVGVAEIPYRAFYGCAGLTSLTLPDTVTVIGMGAFDGCKSLTNLELPDGLTELGSSALSGCSSLTELVIPESVTVLGLNALSGCSGLTELTLPAGLTELGDYALSGCSGLTELTLPEGLVTLGTGALRNCASLTAVTIPASVTNIGAHAFIGCDNLTIYGYTGTTAQASAAENDIPFVALDETDEETEEGEEELPPVEDTPEDAGGETDDNGEAEPETTADPADKAQAAAQCALLSSDAQSITVENTVEGLIYQVADGDGRVILSVFSTGKRLILAGLSAGTTYTVQVKEGAEGIPVDIGSIATADAGPDSGTGEKAAAVTSTSSRSGSTKSVSTSATVETGDEAHPALWAALGGAALAALALLAVLGRRKPGNKG